MAVVRPIPRNLEEPARIFGLTPTELAACALIYAGASSLLRGIPFSTLIALGIGLGIAITLLILNRTKPPQHGAFWCLKLLRRPVTPVTSLTFDNRKD